MSLLNRHSLAFVFFLGTLFGQADMPSSIRFAWLTDTHVGARTGAEDLSIVVHDINKNDSISFVIVSGDISELDVGQNLYQAKSILDSLTSPYYIIPGNHDLKWSSSGGQLFEQLWGADRFNFEVGDYRFIGSHQGPLLRMGAGYIDPADISWVESILQSLPDPRQKIFIVMHYPLDPSVDNWHALRDVLRPFNIQAVLHGHGHSNRATSYEGIPGVMSRSILRRGEQPTGYSIVELYPDHANFIERIPLADSTHLWNRLPLGDKNAQDSLSLPYPDYSENDTSGVEVVWQHKTGSLITSAPTVDVAQVFVSTVGGELIALDIESGHVNWSWQGGGAIHSTPTVKGSRVVIGSVDSTISCISSRNGELLWQVRSEASVFSSALVKGRKVYMGNGAGQIHALNLRNGKKKWTFRGGSGYIETKPVLANGKIIYGAWDESIYALNARNGQLEWQWSDGRSGLLYSPAACWPVVADNKVIVVAPDRVMTAIDISNGETIWRKSGHKVRESIGVSEDGMQVFARTMQDSVISAKTAGDSFDLDWVKHVGFGYDIAPNAMLEKDGYIFFSTDNGSVFCLERATGDLVWRHRISDGLVNTLAVIDSKRVICTAADGKVSLLRFVD
ncbi:MAG: PQQ-binding-like beta-propeller repeat protein [FCB group bacterium]|nr:PQQ-binding-like beta-propeller repeat protein [FCB group bacterium]MBL7027870.1 PQQ-binding-like beta-propeller repeat protein [Candidatus Neomarinimicrobiota bacterium]MBL7121879.1 PQQ-binding-like beta-propeller repeat protein [Candidatus Neomarinimicrobiota bacterium]